MATLVRDDGFWWVGRDERKVTVDVPFPDRRKRPSPLADRLRMQRELAAECPELEHVDSWTGIDS